jgi:flagella basal body P-ring formation protein FlgA
MMLSLPILLAVAATEPGQCQTIEREYILVRDVAALVPEFSKLPADFNLGFVPLSGEPRILRGENLQNIAKNRGVELAAPADLCFKRNTFIPTAEQVRPAMNAAIGIPDAKIEVLSLSQHAAPSGEIVFPRDGLQYVENQKDLLWHGHVRYGEDQHFGLWAKVRISAMVARVVVAANLAAGKPIQAGQVRLERREDSPLDEGAAASLDEVIGFMPKTQLRASTVIRKAQLERQPDVAKGDVVTVHVYEGAAHLSLEARAQQAGMKGSTILMRNPSSGKDFRAQVTGKDQASVGQIP